MVSSLCVLSTKGDPLTFPHLFKLQLQTSMCARLELSRDAHVLGWPSQSPDQNQNAERVWHALETLQSTDTFNPNRFCSSCFAKRKVRTSFRHVKKKKGKEIQDLFLDQKVGVTHLGSAQMHATLSRFQAAYKQYQQPASLYLHCTILCFFLITWNPLEVLGC